MTSNLIKEALAVIRARGKQLGELRQLAFISGKGRKDARRILN